MITKLAPPVFPDVKGTLSKNLIDDVFPPHLELVPQLNELYELQLAFYESRLLTDEEIVQRGAYFARVGERPTRHFLICQGEPLKLADHSSSRLKAFFQMKQFKTGYATHGLFPYRGKFHPQMVKALLNIMGLRPGETVLDPMMGSGTTLIEATLMGIHSIGVDTSPFCRFMTQAKLDGFYVPLDSIQWALRNVDAIFEHFTLTTGHPNKRQALGKPRQVNLGLDKGTTSRVTRSRAVHSLLKLRPVRDYLLLAFLDSAGYSIRSKRKSPFEQFRAILERYLFVARKIQNVLQGAESELGKGTVQDGDARKLPIEDSQVDGILFSPPYSFAIDYLANDAFHLQALGVDIPMLREKMIGLKGKTLKEKYEIYVQDMRSVLGECHRVLRTGRFCTIVVGTNDQQLAKIFGVEPQDVRSIDELLVDLAEASGLALVRRIERQITGMANTMRSERILLLQNR